VSTTLFSYLWLKSRHIPRALAVFGIVSGALAMPGGVATEALTVLFGVLLFVAPWGLSYTGHAAAS
jgi:hypothetical protein